MSQPNGPSRLGPDWKLIAEAQKIELTPAIQNRLEGLTRTMLGLRGLIDWSEEPALGFVADVPEQEVSE